MGQKRASETSGEHDAFKLHDNVRYDVKNGVVTLTGDVNSQCKCGDAEKVAASVLNVKQVVNNLRVKNQKASSSP